MSSSSNNATTIPSPLTAAAKTALKTALLTSSVNGDANLDSLQSCVQHGLPKSLVLRSIAAFHAKKREYAKALVNMGKPADVLPAPMIQHLVDGIVTAVATAASTAAAQKAAAAAASSHSSASAAPSGSVPNPLANTSACNKPLSTATTTATTTTVKTTTGSAYTAMNNNNITAVNNKAPIPAPAPSAPAPLSAAEQWRKKMTQEFLQNWNWSKPQSGLFLKTHDGKFIVAPKSLGAVRGCAPKLRGKADAVRSLDQNQKQTIDLVDLAAGENSTTSAIEQKKIDDKNVLFQARSIQQRLRRVASAKQTSLGPIKDLQDASKLLLDPMTLRRFKLEPKKEGKHIDRSLRKSRANVADTLVKTHKEFLKAIVSHQSDFIRFHRTKRAEVSKLARAVRDHIDRKEKQKERNAELVERDRLAALKANDMRAYSALLEETKNERLKFLLSKTDDYINQVSALLSEQRAEETGYDTAMDRRSNEGSYFLSAHVKKEQVRQPSIMVGGDLKEYQVLGLQWLVSLYNNRLNGILADEMGLGKTIQTIALLAYLMEVKENKGPFLVIVPLSTLSNWVNEFAKWCPSANVITYKGNPQQRKDIYRDQVAAGNFNVLLTTYEYIIRDKASLRKLTWQYCIVDEGHRMKNAQSKFAATLATQYTTRYRVLLTGTPLQNNLPELWALLNFCLPQVFNSAETFEQWFNRPFSQFNASSDNSSDGDMLSSEERMLIIHRLHELLRPFMLRRVKSEVLDQLPEKVEKVLRCELTSWQKALYKQLSRSILDSSGASSGNARGLNNIVMQLRKVCNHPYLFLPGGTGYVINEHMIRSSGKFELLDRILPKLKAAGHRVLLFTQMVQVITLLEDYFSFRGHTSLRLDGSTTADEREKRMYQFNAPDSPYFVFLLSTRAGGLGLNLATADTVIIFDSDWNPSMDCQAQDRAHRIGQRNDVRVFRFISNSPVEEKILSRATEKLTMNQLVVEAGKFDSNEVDNSLERQQLMKELLGDFTNDGPSSNQDPGSSQGDSESQSTSDAGDAGDDNDEVENLNEMLSSNEEDYELYQSIDAKWAATPGLKKGIFMDENSIPDWITFPKGKKVNKAMAPPAEGGREKKKVIYDDGLTEKQFLRMVDKMETGGEMPATGAVSATIAPQIAPAPVETPVASSGMNYFPAIAPAPSRSRKSHDIPPGALPNDINNKLINTTKAIIYYKEAQTKRRLAEVFLERPSPQMYPDYYQVIKEPIGMNDILRKCRARLFTEVKQWFDDWRQLFKNARKYNPEGSWVVNDANTLEKELNRITGKNGLVAMLPQPAPKPLRIKLSLKRLQKGASSDSSGPKSKKSKVSNSPKTASAVSTTEDAKPASSDPAKTESRDNAADSSIYSGVVGMEHRAVSTKKRGKVRSGGKGSRGGGGPGSRGGRGAYKKRDKKTVEMS